MFDFNKKPKIAVLITNENDTEIPFIIPAPNKNLYDRMTTADGDFAPLSDEILSLSGLAVPELSRADKAEIVKQYYDFLKEIQKSEKYTVPNYPEEEYKIYYTNGTQLEKIVSEYTGLNFKEIEEINICDFWYFVRCAVIYSHNQTKEGREYLEKCWILAQDEPDRAGIHELKEEMERRENNGGNG